MQERTKQTLKSLLLATTIAAAIPSVASALGDDEVVLKSADGSIAVSGKLVEFNNEFYLIETTLGELRVSAERVRCEGQACPVFETADADVQIAGSEVIGDGLMPLLMDGFSVSNDAEASITTTNTPGQYFAELVGDQGFGDTLGSYLVSATSSQDAFDSLLRGVSEIGMSSRRIVPDEARALKRTGAGNMISPDQEHILAIDSVVVITHPSNPVKELTTEQLRAIYSGEITNWRDVGGENRNIVLIGRDETSGTAGTFYARIFGEGEDWTLSNKVDVSDSSSDVAARVNERPGAIGYVGYAFQRGAKPVTLVNACGLPMVPDAFSAKTGEYELQKLLYLYNRGDMQDERAQDFLSYSTSEQADVMIAKAGFIDFGILRREQTSDSVRALALQDADFDAYERELADEMLDKMKGFDRLSTTFRFRTGSSKLDKRGRLDMQRLIEFLERQGDDVEIMMVGFTDDVGAYSANLEISQRRADEIAGLFREAASETLGEVAVSATGFGELAPSACNVTDQGRAINRRVEVWIKRADSRSSS